MSYQPQYSYTPSMRPAHHWVDLLVKLGGLLVAVTAAAIMGAHIIHSYSPPARTAPIARIVQYFGKGGLGAVGANQHWTTEASEGTREWRKAVRYCQAQAQQAADLGGNKKSGVPGCATIETLSQSGY